MSVQDVHAVEVLASGTGTDGAPWRVQHVHGRDDVLRLVVGPASGQSVVLTRDDIARLTGPMIRWALDAALDRP